MKFPIDEAWDFHEPYKVLDNLSPNWSELVSTDNCTAESICQYEKRNTGKVQVSSSKWSERKEALDQLKNLILEHPRLDPTSHYGEAVSVLTKIVSKDSNVAVVAVAANCLEGLSFGLRKKFAPFAVSVLPALLLKFKEKKQNVVSALVSAVDAVAPAVKDFEPLVDEILSALTNKNPGIKVQTSLFLQRLLIDLDPKAISKKSLKSIIDSLTVNLGDSDQDVRLKASMALGSAMFFTGERPMMSLLSSISDDSSKMDKIRQYFVEAQKLAEAAKESQAAATSEAAASSTAINSEPKEASPVPQKTAVVEKEDAEIDPWDFHEPTNVLEKLPKDFYEQIASTKWSERKETLELFKGYLVAHPRLDPSAHYGEMVSLLVKLVSKDSNVVVVALAANCLEYLAKGLRKKFSPFSLTVLPVLLQKFKEKKQAVVAALASAVDAVAPTITDLEVAVEDILGALTNKSPGVKIQTSLFLKRFIMRLTIKTLPKKFLKSVCEQLVKNTGESDPEVRESAAGALGSAMKVVGEKVTAIFLAPILDDPAKIEKVRKYCDEAHALAPKLIAPDPPAPKNETAKAPIGKSNNIKSKGKQPAAEVPSTRKEIKPIAEEPVPVPKKDLRPVDIFTKLSMDWKKQIETSETSGRKKALVELNNLLVAHPKLIPSSSYGEIVSILSEIIATELSHEVVVLGAKCLEGLATGLGEKFDDYWKTTRRFSPTTINSIKRENKTDPEASTTKVGAEKSRKLSQIENQTMNESVITLKPDDGVNRRARKSPKRSPRRSFGLIPHDEVNEVLEMEVPKPELKSRALLDARKHLPRQPRDHFDSVYGGSHSTSNELADIFRAIADSNNSKTGIKRLHEHLKKHPETDLEKCMGTSSVHFQNYIKRGLKNCEETDPNKESPPQRRDSIDDVTRIITKPNPEDGGKGEGGKENKPTMEWESMRKRLEEFKKQAGLRN